MKLSHALVLVLVLALAGAWVMLGSTTFVPNVAPSATPTAAVSSASTSPTGSSSTATTWAAQAERCIARLEDVVSRAEAGDRAGALAAQEDAYFKEYENTDKNLEVECKTKLPEELFEGKMRNVVIAREDLFAQVKGAVKAGAPAAKVRSLVDELSAKIRADAAKLDSQSH